MAETREKELEEATSYEITDHDIERAKLLIGVFTASRKREYVSTASHDSIRNFAIGVGDDNPLYTDETYGLGTRWGGQIAPSIMAGIINKPMLGDPIDPDLKKRTRSLFRGIHVFVSGGEWDWYRPIYPGDSIYSFSGETEVTVKPSEFSGRTVTQINEVVKVNQRGEVVGVYRVRRINSERKAARKTGKYSAIEPAQYSPEDIEKIDAVYAAEKVTGANTRYFEDVNVGDSLGEMAKGPLTVTDIIVFHAGGYGFVPYQPCSNRVAYKNRQRIPAFYITNEQGVPDVAQRVHWDRELSLQTTGNPLPYDYGVMRETWLYHYLSDWAGDDGWICRMYDEIRKFNYLGDAQFIRGEVTDKRVEDGRCLVDVSLQMTNQRDVVTVIGNATIALPSRDHGKVLLPEVPQELAQTASRMFARHCELLREKNGA